MLGNLTTNLITGLLVIGIVLAFIAYAVSGGQGFFSRWCPSGEGGTQRLRGPVGMLLLTGAVFLLVAGVGAATSYMRETPEAVHTAHSDSQGGPLDRLKDYTRSIGADSSASGPPDGKLLPDVSTMIERLATRLEAAPNDVKGWRMLGWSYFYTGQYKQAVTAYAKAVELDPKSDDLKFEYEEVKAKAAEADTPAPEPRPHAEAAGKESVGKVNDGPTSEQVAAYQAMPAQERDAAIKSMVDGLASRLESAPRDVEGWTRLMRSRVVLGEREVATTALRKALDIFKDDAAASAKITASAAELGLKIQ